VSIEQQLPVRTGSHLEIPECARCGGRVVPTRPPHSEHTSTQDILNSYTQLFNSLSLILIVNITHDVWIVENIFINSYTLDECTHHCITYSVTAHPDDGQA
jgi:hypothetical protein